MSDLVERLIEEYSADYYLHYPQTIIESYKAQRKEAAARIAELEAQIATLIHDNARLVEAAPDVVDKCPPKMTAAERFASEEQVRLLRKMWPITPNIDHIIAALNNLPGKRFVKKAAVYDVAKRLGLRSRKVRRW